MNNFLTRLFLGFAYFWWIVHFLSTKQVWFNGVAAELFITTQLLGYLTNLSYETENPYLPVLISFIVHFLVQFYRHYIKELRLQDPERTFYQFFCKPLVPKRALQLLQLTPLAYALLLKIRPFIDQATHARARYSIGMADGLIFVAINVDLFLVVLTRVLATLRTSICDFSLSNLAWMFRVNITGSYTIMFRDIGWRSIPSDQLHVSWFFYWIMKTAVVSV